MSIANYGITDLNSFQETIKEPRQIAGLYFYQVLDCLLDLAYDVSTDFRKRPQMYRDLGDASIVSLLAGLNAKYGTEPEILSKQQRDEIYLPIFGKWDNAAVNADDSFPQLRDDLINAAAAFAERAVDTGVEMLRESVRSAHRPFKNYLLGVQGASVRYSADVALSTLTEIICYPILRNARIAAVFGVSKTNDAAGYPYATDPVQDVLAEEISKKLMSLHDSETYITRERISNLQRAALRGAEAIATAIDFEEPDSKKSNADIDLLITKCYTWGAALNCLNGHTAAEAQLQPGVPAIRRRQQQVLIRT